MTEEMQKAADEYFERVYGGNTNNVIDIEGAIKQAYVDGYGKIANTWDVRIDALRGRVAEQSAEIERLARENAKLEERIRLDAEQDALDLRARYPQ